MFSDNTIGFSAGETGILGFSGGTIVLLRTFGFTIGLTISFFSFLSSSLVFISLEVAFSCISSFISRFVSSTTLSISNEIMVKSGGSCLPNFGIPYIAIPIIKICIDKDMTLADLIIDSPSLYNN